MGQTVLSINVIYKRSIPIKKKYILIFILFLVTNLYSGIDWSKLVVESTMERNTPAALGRWMYPNGFYLYGQYQVWQRLGDDKYFEYIRNWLDLHIDEAGNIDQGINSLDNMQPGLITLYCYQETGQEKYKLAADHIRNVIKDYPRTADSAFWHAEYKQHQLWLDGVYMILPFLVKYGQMFDQQEYCNNEATRQIMLYAKHLKDSTGLLYHAYDESGSASWADPETNHSSWFWGRSMGWFGMAIIEILDVIPEYHENRDEVITILQDLIKGLAENQDPETGLWYQVTNKGDDPDNWLETSCSCMYTFFIARAAEEGYVSDSSKYIEIAKKGYHGVIENKMSIGEDNLTYLKDICQGTGVGDYQHYLNRSRNVNDRHGLGAFLVMNEVMAKYDTTHNENYAPAVSITRPDSQSVFSSGSDIDIIVNSFDYDGNVTQVEIYNSDSLLYTDTEEPWEFTWSNVPDGEYTIYAIAYDDSNASSRSASVPFTISDEVRIVEAESGSDFIGTIDNNHAGFTGAGFVNFTNEMESYLNLLVELPKAGQWMMKFRYGNGSENNRPCRIQIGATVIDSSYNFPSTGSWKNWEYSDDELSWNFEAGSCSLKVIALTDEGGPNLDHIRLRYTQPEKIETDYKGIVNNNFRLYPNYPNPFNSATTISYYIPRSGSVNLKIYDLNGDLIKEVIDKYQKAGHHDFQWNAGGLSSGIYIMRIQKQNDIRTRKMILLK